MNKNAAIILLGFQNDFFSPKGLLHEGIKESLSTTETLKNSVEFLNRFKDSDIPIISTPICFSTDYSELNNPSGMMAAIRDLGAFRSNSFGGQMIPELDFMKSRITEVGGKCGFNAFHSTGLSQLLEEKHIESVVILGVVTSVCVDSTGRCASEKGYDVTILNDCTAGRSEIEQSFFCNDIFPLYADVTTSKEYIEKAKQEGLAF